MASEKAVRVGKKFMARGNFLWPGKWLRPPHERSETYVTNFALLQKSFTFN
jgi:hypothetical protein